MATEQFKRAKRIFLAASDKPQEERAEWVKEACGDDEGLRRDVESMLVIQDREDSVFENSYDAHLAPLGCSTPQPQQIGEYRILGVLGEGGMGTVYLAEQTEPIRRRVALKLIKLGMDTKQVIARFETERQALALMNHPNVAKVLDAGATEKGRPYFVMEYVKGESITAYCDRHRLTTKERLGLFMQVCQAVQHTHQKGIIHRDIKPSNVLVAVEGDKPVPKVIDFGVAKATEQKLTERTLFTEQGQLIGTPEYMSPEQAEMTVLDIDTRTDVYSLGVLLYELLVGALPFDPTSLRRAAFAEIQRIIREEELPKPSTRLSSMGDESTTAAQKRSTDQTALQRQLRGDLDWITMRAMDKDRTRRYATAAEFADDIARHLRHEPVLASPPSAAYRARKFIRRNKGPVAATGILLAVLAGGVITSTTFAIQAAKARDKAQRQVEMTRSINDFLNHDLLAAVTPEQQGKDVLMRDVLDTASQAIEGKFDNAPLIEASIRSTLGHTYHKLGDYRKAETHLVRALEIRRAQLGAEHKDTIASMNGLAGTLYMQGKFSEAEPVFRRSIELGRRVLRDDHPDVTKPTSNLAAVLARQGKLSEAEAINRQLLTVLRRALGDEHPGTLACMGNLATVLQDQGNLAAAEPLLRKVLENTERLRGTEHPNTLRWMNNLAALLDDRGKFHEAEPLYRKTLETRRRVLGEQHPDTISSMSTLAFILQQQGNTSEAESLFRKSLEAQQRALRNEHPVTLTLMNNLALLLMERGALSEAEPLCRRALETRREVLGMEHSNTLLSMHNLAMLLRKQGKTAEAEQLYRRTLEVRRRALREGHVDILTSMNDLADLLAEEGQLVEAELLFLEVMQLAPEALSPDHWKAAVFRSCFGSCLTKLARFDEAETHLLEAYQRLKTVFGEDHQRTRETIDGLAVLYDAWGKPEEAARHRARLSPQDHLP